MLNSLSLGVQGRGQLLHEEAEVVAVLGVEAFVVQIEAVEAVGRHQRHQVLHMLGAPGRVVDDCGHGLAVKAGVLDRRHDPKAGRARGFHPLGALHIARNAAAGVQLVPDEVDLADRAGVVDQRLLFEEAEVGCPDGDFGRLARKRSRRSRETRRWRGLGSG